jgi:DNA polymerase I-like protein with 3'-5' exonuclease and polymerase domains
VHDENVVLVPEAEAAQAQQFVERVMSTPPAWAPDLPIACESVLAKNFGECK